MRRKICVMVMLLGIFGMGFSVNAEENEMKAVHETINVLSNDDLSVFNETDSVAKQISLRGSFSEEWLVLEKNIVKEGALYDIKLETEDGDVHVYPGIGFDGVKEISLFEKNDAVYTVIVDKNNEEISTEAYPIVMLEEPAIYYPTSSLNVRATPSTDGEKLYILSIAGEVMVYGETDGWYMIQHDGRYAFASAEHMTEDKALAEEKADEARAEAAARAAAEAAAAAQQYAYSQSQSSNASSGSAVYEVSRENVPGCDDPNHGVTYITYSDGSVKAVAY